MMAADGVRSSATAASPSPCASSHSCWRLAWPRLRCCPGRSSMSAGWPALASLAMAGDCCCVAVFADPDHRRTGPSLAPDKGSQAARSSPRSTSTSPPPRLGLRAPARAHCRLPSWSRVLPHSACHDRRFSAAACAAPYPAGPPAYLRWGGLPDTNGGVRPPPACRARTAAPSGRTASRRRRRRAAEMGSTHRHRFPVATPRTEEACPIPLHLWRCASPPSRLLRCRAPSAPARPRAPRPPPSPPAVVEQSPRGGGGEVAPARQPPGGARCRRRASRSAIIGQSRARPGADLFALRHHPYRGAAQPAVGALGRARCAHAGVAGRGGRGAGRARRRSRGEVAAALAQRRSATARKAQHGGWALGAGRPPTGARSAAACITALARELAGGACAPACGRCNRAMSRPSSSRSRMPSAARSDAEAQARAACSGWAPTRRPAPERDPRAGGR